MHELFNVFPNRIPEKKKQLSAPLFKKNRTQIIVIIICVQHLKLFLIMNMHSDKKVVKLHLVLFIYKWLVFSLYHN